MQTGADEALGGSLTRFCTSFKNAESMTLTSFPTLPYCKEQPLSTLGPPAETPLTIHGNRNWSIRVEWHSSFRLKVSRRLVEHTTFSFFSPSSLRICVPTVTFLFSFLYTPLLEAICPAYTHSTRRAVQARVHSFDSIIQIVLSTSRSHLYYTSRTQSQPYNIYNGRLHEDSSIRAGRDRCLQGLSSDFLRL